MVRCKAINDEGIGINFVAVVVNVEQERTVLCMLPYVFVVVSDDEGLGKVTGLLLPLLFLFRMWLWLWARIY